jgi:diguanylate cyclase (GGDEF)-like protein
MGRRHDEAGPPPPLASPPTRRTLDRESADWGIMLRSLMVIWAVGATFFLVVLVAGHPAANGRNVLFGIDVIAFAVLAILLVGRDQLPTWTPDVCAYLLYLVVGGVVFAFQDRNSAYAFFYLWLSVHSFYFLPWRRAAPQVAFIAIDYAITLLALPGSGFPLLRWAVTVLTTMVICTLVALLRSRVDALVTRLAELARTDPLTGLPNRRAYDDLLGIEMARSDRTGRPFALAIGDIDHFKSVNDRFGHPTGDTVHRQVADRLRTTERRVDVAARLGGEEFALILPDTDIHGALAAVERIRHAVADGLIDVPMYVTMSFGIACYPCDGPDAATLFRAADRALLAAKAAGRNRTVVWAPPVSR